MQSEILSFYSLAFKQASKTLFCNLAPNKTLKQSVARSSLYMEIKSWLIWAVFTAASVQLVCTAEGSLVCKDALQSFEARLSSGPSAAAQEDASVSQAKFTNSQVRQNAFGEAEKYEKGTQNQRTCSGGKTEGQELIRIGHERRCSTERW